MDSKAGSEEGQGSLVCEQTVVLCVGKYHCTVKAGGLDPATHLSMNRPFFKYKIYFHIHIISSKGKCRYRP